MDDVSRNLVGRGIPGGEEKEVGDCLGLEDIKEAMGIVDSTSKQKKER